MDERLVAIGLHSYVNDDDGGGDDGGWVSI